MLFEILCILLYLFTAIWVIKRLFHKQGPNPKLTTLPAFLGLTLHLIILMDSVFFNSIHNLSMLNVASLIAFLVTFTMTLASFAMATAILMPVVYGSSAMIVLLGAVIPDIHTLQLDIQPALMLHIALALLAYVCLIIACLYAIQVSFINGKLKQKQTPLLLHSSLPPLMTVENIFFKLLWAGTVLLTLSLLSGFVFLDNMWASGQAHKTVLSVIAWLIFSITALGHKQWGWRGKPVITATLMGAFILTLGYFGSRFVKEVLLS